MPPQDILRQRLYNQRLEGPRFPQPGDAVRWLGAVQAQDYGGAAWAVGQRSDGLTRASLDAALNRGEILRTHVLRPTWHLVVPEDIGWLLDLAAPQLKRAMAYQNRKQGLDERTLAHTNDVIGQSLAGGEHLTRTELAQELTRSGVDVSDGVRLAHIAAHAELSSLICSGARRGKQHTYALLRERAPQATRLGRAEALAELAYRYFASHGPATVRDYAWWSGLSAADARAGLHAVRDRLEGAEVDGQSYWYEPSLPVAPATRTTVHLLPNYDEYVVAYSERAWLFDAGHVDKLDARRNPLFSNVIICDGRIVGTWKRVGAGRVVQVEPTVFRGLSKGERLALARAGEQYREFEAASASS